MSGTSAEALLAGAEKNAASTGGWFSSSSSKHEQSIELFKGAASKFRVENRMDEAGRALVRAAQMELKTGEKDFAANTFYEASKCFRMGNPRRECVGRAC